MMLFSGITFGMAQTESATDIVRKADERARGTKTMKSEMTIQIVRTNWTRDMEMKSWTKGEDYSLILITAPAREAGSAFLKRDKEVWNWMPNIERNIKLPPSMMGQSWMGTDFTNDDLVREASVVNDYTHKIIGSQIIAGRDTWKIEMTPKPKAAVVWGKVIVYIDKTDYIQLKSEMYDEDGELVNTMLMSDLKEMDGRLIPTRTELIPADKPGQKTVMIMKSAEFDRPIEDEFFTVQNMKRVK